MDLDRQRSASFLAETDPMATSILSLPGWATAIALIGLAAAMIYILFGHRRGRD
jgi:hypothetical protein